MEVIPEAVHRTLAYLVLLHSRGLGIPSPHLDAFYMRPAIKRSTWRSSFLDSMDDGFMARYSESFSDQGQRLGWIEGSYDNLRLTPLGLALVSALNSPKLENETQDFAEVVLRPDDPLAYERLLDRFNDLGPSLLVDPYLRLDQFMEVVETTQVTRILTTEKAFGDGRRKAPGKANYAKALGHEPDVSVMYIGTLHDRFLVPDEGDAIQMLGVSLNGLRNNFSVLTKIEAEGSAAIRQRLDAMWAEAMVLEPARPQTATNPDEEKGT